MYGQHLPKPHGSLDLELPRFDGQPYPQVKNELTSPTAINAINLQARVAYMALLGSSSNRKNSNASWIGYSNRHALAVADVIAVFAYY